VEKIREIKGLRDEVRVFADREAAGQALVRLLAEWRAAGPLVLAVPAGGVPVAAPLAAALGAPLDVAVVSKITLPWNTEAGYGAVAFDGTVRLNDSLLPSLGLSAAEIDRGIEKTRQKVRRRLALFRGERPFPELQGRPVILVDDGLASGLTLQAAVAALHGRGAERLIVAVPTGHARAVERMAAEVEAVCCANVRAGWSFAVADAYERWADVSEEEAVAILKSVTRDGF
jgi:predicted phosphoribosyltransferase